VLTCQRRHLAAVRTYQEFAVSRIPQRHVGQPVISMQQASDASASRRFSKHPERPAPFAKLPSAVASETANLGRWRICKTELFSLATDEAF
jgi:hypothetical protein